MGKRKGWERGVRGFIGEVLMAITARNYWGNNSGRFQERERERTRGEDDADMWVPSGSVREREGKRVPVRGRLEWAVGCFSCRAEGFPGVHFMFFFLFYNFLFSIFWFSLFLHNFCICYSNDFKPKCKIFLNSKKHSRTVTNMFSEPKQDF
jgi:hypothetical protein